MADKILIEEEKMAEAGDASATKSIVKKTVMKVLAVKKPANKDTSKHTVKSSDILKPAVKSSGDIAELTTSLMAMGDVQQDIWKWI